MWGAGGVLVVGRWAERRQFHAGKISLRHIPPNNPTFASPLPPPHISASSCAFTGLCWKSESFLSGSSFYLDCDTRNLLKNDHHSPAKIIRDSTSRAQLSSPFTYFPGKARLSQCLRHLRP